MRRYLIPLLLVTVAACSSGSGSPGTSPTPAESAPTSTVVLPDEALRASTVVLLEGLLRGDEPAGYFLGDRLLVITAETFSEIYMAPSAEFLAAEFSLGGGCNGPCSVRVDVFLRVLLDDLRAGSPAAAPIPVPDSLQSWSPLVVSYGERLWRVSLSADAATIVAVEYFGPTERAF